MDRRNFLTRLAALLPAAALMSQVKTPDEVPGPVSHFDPDQLYARVSVPHEGKPFLEAGPTPNGPFRRVRTGLPSPQWRQLNAQRDIVAMLQQENEILLSLPWVER